MRCRAGRARSSRCTIRNVFSPGRCTRVELMERIAHPRKAYACFRAICAALLAGALTSCGGGSDAGVGPAPTFDFLTPTRVDTTLAFAQVGMGWNHSCMITVTGAAWCWGDDQYGQLGSSEPMQRCLSASVPCSPTPLQVEAT